MSGNHFLHFGTGTGKPKKLSQCLGRERKIQEVIPIVWEPSLTSMRAEASAIPLYSRGEHCIALHYTALHCTALNYTILQA